MPIGLSAAENVGIQLPQLLCHALVPENIGETLLPSWPKRARKAGSAARRVRALARRAISRGGIKKPVSSEITTARCAVDVITHDRLAGNERLRQDPSETFAQTGVDGNIHRADQLGNVFRRHKAGELKIVVQTGSGNLLIQLLAENAVADK